jgi:hypothetical protein
MPCGLTSNLDYPDYIKTILRTINIGNDTDLKACACGIRSPLTTDGCPVIDEDGKVGAFPFCWTYTENSSLFGTRTGYPLKLSLKQAMDFYWKTMSFPKGSIVVNGSQSHCGDDSESITLTPGTLLRYKPIANDPYLIYQTNQTDLVCAGLIEGNFESTFGGYAYGYGYISAFGLIQDGVVVVNPGYYTKVGEEYFFYPNFGLAVGNNTCATFTSDGDLGDEGPCGGPGCGCESIFYSSVNVTVSGKTVDLDMYGTYSIPSNSENENNECPNRNISSLSVNVLTLV